MINALRAHLAELGIVAAQGREGIKELLKIIASEGDAGLPVDAHASLVVLAAELQAMQTMIGSIDKRIMAQHRSSEPAAGEHPRDWCYRGHRDRSDGIGSEGLLSGRDFAAWIGLVPLEDLTGGKQKLGPISKRGDRYLRRILVVGACAVLRYARQQPQKYPWLTQLLARKPFKVVAVVLAEQDGAHRLGIAGQWRHLSGARACGSGIRGLAMEMRLRLCVHELQG